MTELHAAVGLAQIGKHGRSISARRKAAAELGSLPEGEEIVKPVGTLPHCINTFFYYCFTLDTSRLRVDVVDFVKALCAERLGCEHGYPGPAILYMHPVVRDRITFGASGWPFRSPAERLTWTCGEGLCPEAEEPPQGLWCYHGTKGWSPATCARSTRRY